MQVKSTSKPVRAGATTLKVGVDKDDVDRMLSYPAPVYLVGIDETNEVAYIVAINKKIAKNLPSIPITHPLDCANLEILWDEVRAYWKGKKTALGPSVVQLQEQPCPSAIQNSPKNALALWRRCI